MTTRKMQYTTRNKKTIQSTIPLFQYVVQSSFYIDSLEYHYHSTLVAHETITRKPLCLASLHILIAL